MVYNKIIWIHRMAAILSELSSKVNVSALKDKLIDIYAIINDKVVTVKEALSTKSEATREKDNEKMDGKNDKKEHYADPPAPKTTKEKVFDFLTKLKDYFIVAGIILLKVAFYVFLASLVANDMMMYAPTIRAFFFVFTLIVTYNFAAYAFFLTCYYALRRGYDYYHQNLSSEKVKPPKSFPMIFAILPLTTYYPESPVARFFMWAFMYQKSDNPARLKSENDRLEVIMAEYWKDLNKSFDYLNKIKTTEPFSRLYELNKEHITKDNMHPIQKPETVIKPGNPLPNVIENEQPKEEPTEEPKEEKKIFYAPQAKEQVNTASENNAIVATAIAEVAKQPSA